MKIINNPFQNAVEWNFSSTEDIPVVTLHIIEGMFGNTQENLVNGLPKDKVVNSLAKMLTKRLMREIYQFEIGDRIRLEVFSSDMGFLLSRVC